MSALAIIAIVLGGTFVLGVGSCVVCVAIGARSAQTAPTARPATPVATAVATTPTATAVPDPPGSFRDGTHVIGTDVAPGTYRTQQRAPGCYWARLAGFSGESGDLIANGNESGPVIITIGKSDKGFESKRCGLWVSDLSAITSSPTEPFGDGIYIVGTDIAPGTWQSDSPESCYWARLRGFSGAMGDLITNANRRAIVTIAPTDKGFRSHKCGTWSKMN